MLVTLYTSRIVLNALGVEDYGIYNIVGGVVFMFSFFSSAMSSATQRFLSYDIGIGNFFQLRKTFNASQIIHIGIGLFVIILGETIGVWFIKTYLIISNTRLESALWVYHFTVFSFFITIIQVPYHAAIVAHERMNVYAYVSILEVTLKLLIVFILTWTQFDKLKLYGILHFLVVFIIAIVYRIYVFLNFKESKFKIVKDKKLYKTLFSYSGWNLFGNIASVAKNQGVSVILNIFFGPIVNAAHAIANQVQAAVNSFVNNFQIAVNPQIIKYYAIDEIEYMTLLVIRSAKFSFYLLFLLSLPIILEVDQILKVWLKTVPEYTAPFTILTIVIILINCISGPLMTTVQATGKIKTYQVVVGTLQILVLPVSYIFLKLGYPPMITLFVNIFISSISLFFRLFFLKNLIDFSVLRFLKEVVSKCILIFILSISLPLFIRNKMDENIERLIIVVILSVIWSGMIVYLFGFDKSERSILLKYIKRISKIIK